MLNNLNKLYNTVDYGDNSNALSKASDSMKKRALLGNLRLPICDPHCSTCFPTNPQ